MHLAYVCISTMLKTFIFNIIKINILIADSFLTRSTISDSVTLIFDCIQCLRKSLSHFKFC